MCAFCMQYVVHQHAGDWLAEFSFTKLDLVRLMIDRQQLIKSAIQRRSQNALEYIYMYYSYVTVVDDLKGLRKG